MILGLLIGTIILFFIFGICASITDSDVFAILSVVCAAMLMIIFIFGCFNGFVNHPKTEGIHQGIITAVDLEGIYFRRYEVYLKSSGYTEQSDETKYLIYDYEKDLAKELQNAIGKKVKLYYGHDGGYIGWNSCGTYHIKSVEIIEE